jgi:hypothetical protein
LVHDCENAYYNLYGEQRHRDTHIWDFEDQAQYMAYGAKNTDPER